MAETIVVSCEKLSVTVGKMDLSLYMPKQKLVKGVKFRKTHPICRARKYTVTFGAAKLGMGWEVKKRLYPQNSSCHVYHETIYHHIYAPEYKEKKLWEYWLRQQKKRKKKVEVKFTEAAYQIEGNETNKSDTV